MTIVKAGGKDIILPGDGFDAFVDFVFNTPSQPELCEMKKEEIVMAVKLAEPTVAAAANNASTQTNGKGATPVATLWPKNREKKNKPGSIPPDNAKNCANAGKTVEDFQKAKRDSSCDGEGKCDDKAYHQPYAFKLSLSYLESIKKQNSLIDYSDSHSVTSGVGGDSSAWSFSAVGKDDDTYASIEDNTFRDSFHNSTNFEEKVPDESDEPAVNKPYFLKSSSSYLSEKSGHEDGNASTWSFSAVGADYETYVTGRSD